MTIHDRAGAQPALGNERIQQALAAMHQRCARAQESDRVGLRGRHSRPPCSCRRGYDHVAHARGTVVVAGPDTRLTALSSAAEPITRSSAVASLTRAPHRGATSTLNLLNVIGVILVGLAPLAGLAIGRSIKRRRDQDGALTAEPSSPPRKVLWWVIIPGILATLIIRAVFTPGVALALLFALTVICFALAIVQQRRLRSRPRALAIQLRRCSDTEAGAPPGDVYGHSGVVARSWRCSHEPLTRGGKNLLSPITSTPSPQTGQRQV